jgi:hypothetical protein
MIWSCWGYIRLNSSCEVNPVTQAYLSNQCVWDVVPNQSNGPSRERHLRGERGYMKIGFNMDVDFMCAVTWSEGSFLASGLHSCSWYLPHNFSLILSSRSWMDSAIKWHRGLLCKLTCRHDRGRSFRSKFEAGFRIDMYKPRSGNLGE